MGGKLNLYNLGDIGVDLVSSPVHSADGSLVSAQNAQTEEVQGAHTIGKRLGLALLTPEAMDGPVLAIANIPFPDPFAPLPTEGSALFANTQTDGAAFNVRTLDGTTWTTVDNLPTRWFDTVLPVGAITVSVRGGAISGRDETLIYSDTANLKSFDGSSLTTLVAISPGADDRVRGICLHDDAPHLLITDIVANTAVVKRWNGTTLASVGAAIVLEATMITSAFGALWIGTNANVIYRWSADDGLTTALTITPGGGATLTVTDITLVGVTLYASCGTSTGGGATGEDNLVLVRNLNGTWSDVTPAGAAEGLYGPMVNADGALLAVRNGDGAFTGCDVWRLDGDGWAVDLDVTTITEDPTSTIVTAILAFNGAVYALVQYAGEFSTHYGILRRAGGAWSLVFDRDAASQDAPVSTMGFY